MTAAPLFTPFRLGSLELPNRVVLAPLTRSRAGDGLVPNPLAPTYYAQRASGGLLITEATQVGDTAQGYPNTPGLYTDAQVEGWRRVTDAVHAAGGRVFVQLWHVGRVSLLAYQPGGALPLAPSAIAADGQAMNPQFGFEPFPTPRALETDELPGVAAQFGRAARLAKAAGFDGVEVHGANGYLIEQFLRAGSNTRTDRYGGSVENRARFLLEAFDAVASEIGADRTGVRVSPHGKSAPDPDVAGLYGYVAAELGKRGAAYLHVVEPAIADHPMAGGADATRLAPGLKAAFGGPVILNGGFDAASANAAIESGAADLVSFGTSYLANPDLPERLRVGAPLNAPDRATFYGGDARGYTDYPTLGEAAKAA